MFVSAKKPSAASYLHNDISNVPQIKSTKKVVDDDDFHEEEQKDVKADEVTITHMCIYKLNMNFS